MTDREITLAAQKAAVAELEERLWQHGFDESRLADYQAAFRRLEQLIDEAGTDVRHKFVIVIPVADRPQHLRSCLGSVLELCRTFGYGGIEGGRYRKVEVVIADDSRDAAHIASNKQLAAEFTALGVATRHFGQDEQFALVESVRRAEPAGLRRVLSEAPRDAFGHKGQGVMRNIAYLELQRTATVGERVLFYSIDSDQEFKVKLPAAGGDREVCAVNFFYRLDEIFAATDAMVLTGKVVGDPPVSPAVMIGNFLEDVTGFLHRMAASEAGGDVPCRQHRETAHTEADAAYHDMADLFGFGAGGDAYGYRCPLVGEHTDADCFEHFAARLNSFFYGEHPTRLSFYAHAGVGHAVVPARTVYAGNYVFRPEALEYFIPFAALRLRMSGPTLGRLIRAEIGERFVSANLPMLHKRTVETTGQSEFRPGISTAARSIDLSGEFERQFYGDVMLFSIERLTTDGFPAQPAGNTQVAETMDGVRTEVLQRYNAKRVVIGKKLRQLTEMIDAPTSWWNASSRHAAAREAFVRFAANVAHNFGDASLTYERINSAESWARWRAGLIDAVVGYPDDRCAWRDALDTAAGR